MSELSTLTAPTPAVSGVGATPYILSDEQAAKVLHALTVSADISSIGERQELLTLREYINNQSPKPLSDEFLNSQWFLYFG